MDIISFHSFWTVVTVVAFILLVVWAWNGRQKNAFDRASRIPLEDHLGLSDSTPVDEPAGKENKHE